MTKRTWMVNETESSLLLGSALVTGKVKRIQTDNFELSFGDGQPFHFGHIELGMSIRYSSGDIRKLAV